MIALLVVTGLLVEGLRPVAAQSVCLPADAFGANVLTDLQNLATSSDSADAAKRMLAHLPATSASNVTYMTDERTCQKGVTALNAMFQTPGAARRVYLFKYSTSFVTVDPALPIAKGGADAEFVFNKQWVLQLAMVSP
jgi:hypothetical protein